MNVGRSSAGVRERVLDAATTLLVRGGPTAVSTRNVCAAAGIQAPTLYRLFGDKQGLLDAVAVHGFHTYLDDDRILSVGDDPVDDLRRGWDMHVSFGLANPRLYSLAYGDARSGVATPAAAAADAGLATLVNRVARAGRLGVAEPTAVQIMHAAGCGTTMTLIAVPEDRRDPDLSAVMRESAISSITAVQPPAPTPSPVGAAVQLRATLPDVGELSRRERELLGEWLDRIIDRGGRS